MQPQESRAARGESQLTTLFKNRYTFEPKDRFHPELINWVSLSWDFVSLKLKEAMCFHGIFPLFPFLISVLCHFNSVNDGFCGTQMGSSQNLLISLPWCSCCHLLPHHSWSLSRMRGNTVSSCSLFLFTSLLSAPAWHPSLNPYPHLRGDPVTCSTPAQKHLVCGSLLSRILPGLSDAKGDCWGNLGKYTKAQEAPSQDPE